MLFGILSQMSRHYIFSFHWTTVAAAAPAANVIIRVYAHIGKRVRGQKIVHEVSMWSWNADFVIATKQKSDCESEPLTFGCLETFPIRSTDSTSWPNSIHLKWLRREYTKLETTFTSCATFTQRNQNAFLQTTISLSLATYSLRSTFVHICQYYLQHIHKLLENFKHSFVVSIHTKSHYSTSLTD